MFIQHLITTFPWWALRWALVSELIGAWALSCKGAKPSLPRSTQKLQNKNSGKVAMNNNTAVQKVIPYGVTLL